MSSFRRPKSEAALRLYNLPRRELQALCKQYGIPANKTNVAMADALSACVSADNVKPKASAGSGLGIAKTTPMKLKLEKKIALPETSLASFILTGKRKVSPMKLAERPAAVEEGGFPKPNTTPLKRGVKRPVQTEQEEKPKVVTAIPAFTRAAALQDRFGKASIAPALSSPKPPVLTPRKRAGAAAAVVTRRGGDALPPVSFSDLVATPKKSQVHEIIDINSTGKTAGKVKTRLGLRTGPQEEETSLPLPHGAGAGNKVSKGKRVVFADEVEPPKVAEPEPEPETETETIEISYAEIEFKDAAIHKELFGFQRNTTVEEEQDVAKIREEYREDASDSAQETGFEFRDMALHQEIFGAHGKNESECEEIVPSPALDLQQVGISDIAVESESLQRGISNSLAEVVNYSSTEAVQDHSALPSICEDACEGPDGLGEALEEHTEQHLAEGPDPSPLPNNNLAKSPWEKSSEVPEISHASSMGCPTAEIQRDSEFTLEQEPPLISSSANAHLDIDEGRELGDTQQHQSENHEDAMLVDGDTQQHQSLKHDDGLGDESLDKQCSEETLVNSVPVPDEDQKAQSISTLEFDVQRSPLGVHEKEKTEPSPSVASGNGVMAAGPELVMSGSSSPLIPVIPATDAQDNSMKRLSGPGSSNIPVTPAANVQDHSAKRLSASGSFNVPVTPVANALDNSTKKFSSSGSFNIPVTPVAHALANSTKRLSASGSFNIPATPVAHALDNSTKRLSGLRSSNNPVTPAANALDNSARRLSSLRSSNISVTPPTNIQHDSARRFSVPSSSDIPVTPVTKLQDNKDSALAMAATPLTKIQSDIDSTLAKATSILEKLAAWRADAERKMKENYWEPKFSTVLESDSAAPDAERPLAKTVLAVDRDVPSAKKARPTPKPIVAPEKPLTVCEDTDIVSKGDMPSAKKMRISEESKDLSEVSEKENQSDKSIDSDKSFRKMGGLGKDKKKGKKFEVLKDRSKNLPDHGNGLATIKESTGLIRPGDMSLRKLRAQVKLKVSQLEASKASPLRAQKPWNTSH